jgi:Flp pilus assembly protein TadD/lysophospholipase L1-like esterase
MFFRRRPSPCLSGWRGCAKNPGMSTRGKQILLALLAPLILLGAGEGVMRLADLGYPTSFLVPRERNGQTVWVDNPFFGYRFFPPRLARMSSPLMLDKDKPPGSLRIVVLGESAALGDPQPEIGLPRFLELQLEARFPERRVEVINAAMTAINSHVIVEIAHELAAFQPDAFVVYMGNNEVVGPYGPGTVFAASARWTRLRVLLSRLRLAGLVRGRADTAGWTGLAMFAGREVAADDVRLREVYVNFRANLQRVLDIAARRDIPVILSTVAVNLRDCAPFAGEAARAAFAAGRREEARDLDTLRFRADGRLNELVREAAARAGGAVTLVDAAAQFGQPGRDEFVDHVHFTPAGNHRLATALADALAPAPARSLEESLQRLVYNPWTELDLVEGLLERRARAPFVNQPGNAEVRAELENHRHQLREPLARATADALRPRFQAALARRPGDVHLLIRWSEVLVNVGAYAEAERVLRHLLDAWPQRWNIRSALALTLAYQGRADEGAHLLREAPGRHGAFAAEFLLATARALSREGRKAEALIMAVAAVEESPHLTEARLERAACYAALGRLAEAGQDYGDVVRLQPANLQAREEWAGFLALQERWAEAESVLRAGGNDPALRVKLVQLWLARRDRAAADRELQFLEAQDYNPPVVKELRRQWQALESFGGGPPL